MLDAVVVQEVVAGFYIFAGIIVVLARKKTRFRDLALFSGVSMVTWGASLGLSVAGVIELPLWVLLVVGSAPPLFIAGFAGLIQWGPPPPKKDHGIP